MPIMMRNRQGKAPMKDLGLGVSGAPFFAPPRGGLSFAIQFRCYPIAAALTLILLFLLTGCQSAETPFQVPTALPGGWTQVSIAPTDAARKPEWMARLGITQARTVRYNGSIEADADIYELRSNAAALECMQLWKRTPGETFLMKRNLFVVIRSAHPNREMVMDFSRALEKAL